MEPRREGVCAFIPSPSKPQESFLALRENEWKRLTNKVPGMLTPVIETVEFGETHSQALKRAISEELTQTGYKGLIPEDEELKEHKLCEVQLSDNAWLVAYHIDAKRDPRFCDDLDTNILPRFGGIIPGRLIDFSPTAPFTQLIIARDEVEPVGWVSFAQVLATEREEEQNRFLFRPGVVEIVQSYLSKLADPVCFRPGIYPNPINSVPSELFDALEKRGVGKAGQIAVDIFGQNNPALLFNELQVAEAMREVNINPTSYLERLRDYANRVYGFELAPF